MKSKSVSSGTQRTFVLVLDQDEEAFKVITEFANTQGISGASVLAVGAFAEAKVGWFDLAAKQPIPVSRRCEVLSLAGDVARETMARPVFIFTPCSDCGMARCGEAIFLSGSVRPDPRSHDHGNSGASAQEEAVRVGNRTDQRLAGHFAGGPKSSGGSSICGTSILILLRSTLTGLSSRPVTVIGNAITSTTMIACRPTQGSAPQ